MKMPQNFDQLKEMAIAIKHPISIRWPQYKSTDVLTIKFDSLIDKTYSMNNNVVAFACDGILYVIPYIKQVMDILLSNNFTRHSMYVPFSNWDYPIACESKWNDLKRLAKEG